MKHRLLGASEILVKAGEHDLLDHTDGATSHDVKYIHNHPQYECASYDYDYTILELAVAIDLTGSSKARPACLPDAGDIAFAAGTNFTVSGWGMRAGGKRGDGKLHHVTVPYVDDATCKQALGYQGIPKSPTVICAGYVENGGVATTSCNGDSGGTTMKEYKIWPNELLKNYLLLTF